MQGKKNLYLCMGSACHQMGVYEVLPRLQYLLREHGVEEHIELKGAFCLEDCSAGIVMKLGDVVFAYINNRNVDAKFIEEILPAIQQLLTRTD